DDSAAAAGAVYVFTRSGNTWNQQAYIKASNTGSDDEFGSSLGFDSTGNTLAVGARGEASAAEGIGGDQGDNSRSQAGAVYLY
ncbi:MAG: FG-GAP repeat protein, partial [Cytophagales bacterium]|nr:FG-GAP repeat protein [Cytophagales bacterium]